MNVLRDALPFLGFFALVALFWLIFTRVLPPMWRRITQVGRATAARMVARERTSPRFAALRERFSGRAVYLPIVLIVLAGALLAFWSGDAFLDLAEMLHSNSSALSNIDRHIHDAMVMYRSDASTMFFVTAADVGGPLGCGLIVAVVAAILVIRKRLPWLTYLLVTCGGGALLNLALKNYFQRQRPDLAVALRGAHGYSFPSGHAMGSMIVFSSLAYLGFRASRTWSRKALCLALALTSIIAVSASRIYLGVHWISDVGAGLAAGALWVTTTTAAYELFRQIYHVRERRRLATRS